MIALLFAAACYGAAVDNVIIVDQPEADRRVCIYRRDPSHDEWVWYMAVPDSRLPGPFCTTVYPGWTYARSDVPKGQLCPDKPELLTTLDVRHSTD